MENLVGIAGVGLLAVLCVWGAMTLAKSLNSLLRNQITYDRQLGMVRRDDHPKLFYSHAIGMLSMLLICVAIAIFLVYTIL